MCYFVLLYFSFIKMLQVVRILKLAFFSPYSMVSLFIWVVTCYCNIKTFTFTDKHLIRWICHNFFIYPLAHWGFLLIGHATMNILVHIYSSTWVQLSLGCILRRSLVGLFWLIVGLLKIFWIAIFYMLCVLQIFSPSF